MHDKAYILCVLRTSFSINCGCGVIQFWSNAIAKLRVKPKLPPNCFNPTTKTVAKSKWIHPGTNENEICGKSGIIMTTLHKTAIEHTSSSNPGSLYMYECE